MRVEAPIVECTFMDKVNGETQKLEPGLVNHVQIGLHTLAVTHLGGNPELLSIQKKDGDPNKVIEIRGAGSVTGYQVAHELGIPGVPNRIFQFIQTDNRPQMK